MFSVNKRIDETALNINTAEQTYSTTAPKPFASMSKWVIPSRSKEQTENKANATNVSMDDTKIADLLGRLVLRAFESEQPKNNLERKTIINPTANHKAPSKPVFKRLKGKALSVNDTLNISGKAILN
jgi:hypothetical protein